MGGDVERHGDGGTLNIRLGGMVVVGEGEMATQLGSEVATSYWWWRRGGERRRKSAELDESEKTGEGEQQWGNGRGAAWRDAREQR